MFGTRKRRTLSLIVVGIATVGAVTYGTFSLETHIASASPRSEQAVPVAQAQELRATILKMLDEHMGLTKPDAEKLAATMTPHMRGVTQGANIAEMMKSCSQDGTGMMNQSNTTEPSGQSNNTHESHHQSGGMM